jgi:hypothetical protein
MGHSDSVAVRRVRLAVLGSALVCAAVACGDAGIFGGTGTATLSWTAVTHKTDGALLTNLAGYKVYYGTSLRGMNTMVVVPNPRATSYVVNHLGSGTWYFVVAAYTNDGTQGVLSNVREKIIP